MPVNNFWIRGVLLAQVGFSFTARKIYPMKNRQEIYQDFFSGKEAEGKISIHDLREKELRNEPLKEDEAQAVLNFDRYRLSELNKIKSDFNFNARFCELQALANIMDYKEFLKEEYFFSELL